MINYLFLCLQAFGSFEQQGSLSEILVSEEPLSRSGIRNDEISRVEVISREKIKNKKTLSFAQVMDDQKGVDTQVSCAFCGSKRITINGLKGEHTTLLVDGLNLHSTISSFYGVETIPLVGIDEIEVYRGSGSALTAPESLGGAIQILTRPLLGNETELRLEIASDEQKSITGSAIKKMNPEHGVLIGLSYGETRPLDNDQNKISELPAQKNANVFLKHSYRRSDLFEVNTRFSFSQMESVGGRMSWKKLERPVPLRADSSDFVDSDVRNDFIGDKDKITDNVNLTRAEIAQVINVPVSESESVRLKYGFSKQELATIYTHAYDYDNDDEITAAGIEYEKIFEDDSNFRLGIDGKSEIMNSQSDVLFIQRTPPLKQDDLRSQQLGLYGSGSKKWDNTTDISAGLRVDHLRTQWRDLARTLDRAVVAPRFLLKKVHNPIWTSRLALGVGYRSPLTLFESEHGTDHDGFVLEIDEIETSENVYYSLTGQSEKDFYELGVHLTNIHNMTYAIDSDVDGEPTRFANSNSSYFVQVYDASYGQRLNNNWQWESLVEIFRYPNGYKAKLPVAAVESRASFITTWESGSWKSTQKLSVVGERNLKPYNYDRHYNRAYIDLLLPDPVVVTDQKKQRAPTYLTLDLTLDRVIDQTWTAQFSILNVFDYTQTSAGDSPLTWDLHGDHFHLDNFHIWGPLRGRQFFFGLSGVW